MAIWTSEVDGLEDLIRAVAKLPEEALKDVEGASIVSGDKILTDAKSLVPVSSSGKSYYGKGGYKGKEEWNHAAGNLRDHLKLKAPSNRRKNKYYISSSVGFDRGAAYGVPLELGHELWFFGRPTNRHVKERPFLRAAADRNKTYSITATEAAMNSALEKFSKL